MKRLFYGTIVVVMILNIIALAAPEPAIIQAEGLWTVDVKFEQPEQILVKLDKNQKPQRFWYTIVTLTNRTGKDIDFYPQAQLMTNTLAITTAGQLDVTPYVFKEIKLRHQTKFPFIELLEGTTNKLLQGSDNTKDIALIWPDFDKKAKKISIFISGLSNEIAVIDHPVKKDENGDAEKVLLTKTLQIDYILAGDPAFRDNTKLIFENKTWVMR